MKSQNVNHPIIQTLGINHLPEPIVDEVSASEIYYGYAPMGTDEDETGWLIMRKKKTGTVTKCEYAGGRMSYEFKWTERTKYIYSR